MLCRAGIYNVFLRAWHGLSVLVGSYAVDNGEMRLSVHPSSVLGLWKAQIPCPNTYSRIY